MSAASSFVHQCAICFDDMTSLTFQKALLCAHVFHKDCVDKWLRNQTTCPTCRVVDNDPILTVAGEMLLNQNPSRDQREMWIRRLDAGHRGLGVDMDGGDVMDNGDDPDEPVEISRPQVGACIVSFSR